MIGDWSVGIDLLEKGVEYDWHESFTPDPNGLVRGWDIVSVPHCYTLDSRYNITGKVWYRRTFKLPENVGEKVYRIRFGAVHYKTRIWINGNYMGTHEGGYTPFAYDLTRVVKPGINHISVEVDNRWDDRSVPAARIGNRSQDQVYPWYEYGGIMQDVILLVTDKAFITRQKIEPVIDLKKNTAVLNIMTWANLYTARSSEIILEGFITYEDNPGTLLARFAPKTINASPYMENLIQISLPLNIDQVRLWDFDHPHLYILTTIITSGSFKDTLVMRTGLRTIGTSKGQLLLNGQPIRLGGAKRHRDFPGFSSMDLQHVAETGLDKHLERVHEAFPEKPVLITEFGKRSDFASEEEREKTLLYYLNTMRQYPFVANASWWAYNDYKSLPCNQ